MRISPFAALQARIAARLTVQACGIIVISISAMALIGYAIDWTGLYQWNRAWVGMAPNTAVAFIVTGTALTTLGASNRVWKCL